MANYDLDLMGKWLFHEGDFDRKERMAGDEYHASSKAGGALRHLKGFNDRSLWREVTLPHDWLTELPIDGIFDATPGCKRRGVAWYRKFFSLPDEEIECAELVFDGLKINQTTYEVYLDDELIEMPPKEFELLYYLAKNPNKVFTRNQLLDEVWGYEFFGDSRTVDVHIKRIREKIEKGDKPWKLKTIWSVGYKFSTE